VGPFSGDFVVLARLVKLKFLDLSYCDLSHNDMKGLMKLRQLEWLRLKACSTENMEGGIKYLEHVTTLTSLNLSQCDLNDQELGSFLPRLVNLTWLHLKGCPNLSSDGFRGIGNLKCLR
jgi:hypothetical protein